MQLFNLKFEYWCLNYVDEGVSQWKPPNKHSALSSLILAIFCLVLIRWLSLLLNELPLCRPYAIYNYSLSSTTLQRNGRNCTSFPWCLNQVLLLTYWMKAYCNSFWSLVLNPDSLLPTASVSLSTEFSVWDSGAKAFYCCGHWFSAPNRH